jgi:hypothetical protein
LSEITTEWAEQAEKAAATDEHRSTRMGETMMQMGAGQNTGRRGARAFSTFASIGRFGCLPLRRNTEGGFKG